MVEIEMPCCGNEAVLEELADTIGCERCGVFLELAEPYAEVLPVAA